MGRDEDTKACATCALCIHTHRGDECHLTDKAVNPEDGCDDYIPNDEN